MYLGEEIKMNTIENINTRRSIRRYTNKPISRNELDILLACAIKSPSAKNRQPWKFIVCNDMRKQQIVDIMTRELDLRIKNEEYRGSLRITIEAVIGSSHLILVENRFTTEGLNDKYRIYADIQSIGASIQNLCLAAREFGIGSLWICDIFFCDDKIKELFNIKNDIVAAISLGYAAETPKEKSRIDTLETIQFVDSYSPANHLPS
jgi:nitroreductase